MDRTIPKEKLHKERRKRWIKAEAAISLTLLAVWWGSRFFQSEVSRKDLLIARAETATLEASINASGKIVPAFEEIITSPIPTRIIEVYRRGGDTVEAGTPLLRLDLQSTETEYRKQADEASMKQYQLEQAKLNNQTYLNNLAMQIKVAEMKLNRMESALKNERYLDSLGSGTTEKVREAELAFRTGQLELEQLMQQYRNEQEVKAADLKVKQLELNIFRKELDETKRTLDDAQIRSPRKATLTYINDQIGAAVAQGEQLAVLSDLSRFKATCEISDAYASQVVAGGKALVKTGQKKWEGFISSVTPLSKNGVISFTVQLEDAGNAELRSGLRAEVYVINDIRTDALTLPNASYYTNEGEYQLFVVTDEQHLKRRKVRLGKCSYDKVEVLEGLSPGEQVVISPMDAYQSRNELKLTD